MDPREAARHFATAAKDALGEQLESVLLYGSVVRGEYIAGVSDVNVLVLIDDISGSSLARFSPIVRSNRAERVHPIVVELREWRRAADVFAIELSEMQDWHELLHGPDPLIGLLVSPAHLRLQAEHELRGKLLQLHLGMLAAETPEQLGSLLLAGLPSVVTYFRTALRLARRDVSRDAERTLREGCALVDANPSGLLHVLEARRTRTALPLTLQDQLIDQFNTAAEQLAAYIDTLEG